MAFNWPVFKTRAQTALIFVAVMAAGLLTSHWLFLLLFSVIHWGCWIEYQSIMSKIHPEYKEIGPFHRYGVILAGLGLLLFATADFWKIGNVSISAFGFWIALIMAFVLPVTELLFSRHINLKNIWTSLKGLVYISLSLALMIHIRSGDIWRMADKENLFFQINVSSAAYTGFLIPLIIIGSIWINDTMAYLVGSFIGKTPLSKISPRKTWEGTVGGIILSVAIISLVGYLSHASWLHYLAISLIASVAGTFGDLYESKLKRMANVKDSGSFMPGHGGFLDRFDSLLFAVPFVWLYAVAFM
ncbi:MAG TPA: phosphatidate cytidylyltransferase [Chitinophagaceae bacterium]|nr:phosphatidate cytidylyltransferase [Chitinophagaceae bacterium]